ncbi:MAG: DUF2889 domain-containing protein [bacterium]
MRLELRGHPIHTRALSVVVEQRADGGLLATADLLDLRKRGFTPVGSELQGAGVIHQMGLEAEIAGGVLTALRPRQPVVAFEASPATRGESCRDVVPGLTALLGTDLASAAAALRGVMGGAAGCSHLLAAAQLLFATLAGMEPLPPCDASAVQRRVLRRDLLFDGSELADGGMGVAVQLSDLRSAPAADEARPGERFARHDELRLSLDLQGWPAQIAAIGGAERRREAGDFVGGAWRDLATKLAPLSGMSLGKGAGQGLAAALAGHAPLRDALLQLGPALIQCRASFPDKWLNVAMTTPAHDGLIGMPDSCYMWRRGGALQRIREERKLREES